ILSPVALGPSESRPIHPRRATLRGARLGIRIDHAPRSWWQGADENAAGGPRANPPRRAPLRGARLGIRIDHAWRSWWQAADEIATLARAELGVADIVIFDPESRIGRPEEESEKVREFARSVDAAVVGLGT